MNALSTIFLPWRRQSKPTAEQMLTLDQRGWLLLAACVSIAPKAPFLPLWAIIAVALCLLWNGALLRRKVAQWPRWRWRLGALMVLGLLGVVLQFRASAGRDAAVTLVVILTGLKLMEAQSERDGRVTVLLCYFQSFLSMLYDQSIVSTLVLVLSLWLTTIATIVVHHPALRPRQLGKTAALLLVQGLPVAVALFLLFPRPANPFWGVPRSDAGRTGLSDSMSPGSISDLVRSSAVAFQVTFPGGQPKRTDLYWRAMTLSQLDNSSVWRVGLPRFSSVVPADPVGPAESYQIVLEPHDKPWLFTLDYPVAPAPDTLIGRDFQMVAKRPVTTLLRYSLESRPRLPDDYSEDSFLLHENLRLPAKGNPKARALAQQWRSQYADERALIKGVLSYYPDNKFTYTLSPPLMTGDTIDQFLFSARQGFCEHYAGSFVFLMRAAGVPARVVAGYQGGEFNAVSQTLVVRQYDAHAWAEVWLAKEHRWLRVDPTASISPQRVEEGLSASVGEGLSAPVYLQTSISWIRTMRDYWQAASYRWDLWVLNYGQSQQDSLLKWIGFEESSWRTLGLFLIVVIATLVSLSCVAMLWRIRPYADPIGRRWQRLSRRIASQGLARQPWEGPMDYIQRVAQALPHRREVLLEAGRGYMQLRFGPRPHRQIWLRWKKLMDKEF